MNERRRVQYINDPSFQLRIGFLLAGIGVGCFLIMGFLTYLSIKRGLEQTLSPALGKLVLERMIHPSVIFGRIEVVIPIVLLTILIFSIGIVTALRLAGPMFLIKRHLDDIQSGKAKGPIVLKASDEFKDVGESLNSFLAFYESRDQSVEKQIDCAIDMLGQKNHGAAIEHLEDAKAILKE
jgi:methyl-accepting chemotaxis protein